MEFSPFNIVVKSCIQGMAMEENGRMEEAGNLFAQAWKDATDDFEKFLAAYYVARIQENTADKLKWYETALQLATATDNESAKGAFPSLYTHIAQCHEAMGNADLAAKNRELAGAFDTTPSDKGPFYHGTKANVQTGDMLIPGHMSNYKDDLQMNHIYFTAMANGAGLAAALAKGDSRERVYIVEPTAGFENDPNVTDKKFPGNPTRSYRTAAPLKIAGEVTDWARQAPEDLKSWREKVDKANGDIIN